MALGELLAGVAEILAIVKMVQEIIEHYEETMSGVNTIISDLKEASEGSMADTLVEAVHSLKVFFEKLVTNFQKLISDIGSHMDILGKTDQEGAELLKSVLQ